MAVIRRQLERALVGGLRSSSPFDGLSGRALAKCRVSDSEAGRSMGRRACCMQSEKGRHGWEVGEGREPKKFGI